MNPLHLISPIRFPLYTPVLAGSLDGGFIQVTTVDGIAAPLFTSKELAFKFLDGNPEHSEFVLETCKDVVELLEMLDAFERSELDHVSIDQSRREETAIFFKISELKEDLTEGKNDRDTDRNNN